MEGGRQALSIFMLHSLLSDTLVAMTIVLFRLVTARTASQKNFQFVWVCISVRPQAIYRVTARGKSTYITYWWISLRVSTHSRLLWA